VLVVVNPGQIVNVSNVVTDSVLCDYDRWIVIVLADPVQRLPDSLFFVVFQQGPSLSMNPFCLASFSMNLDEALGVLVLLGLEKSTLVSPNFIVYPKLHSKLSKRLQAT
jgi:hypothetical protein